MLVVYQGLAPIKSIQEALRKANWSIESVDLFELNEVYAAQSVAVLQQLQIDPQKVFLELFLRRNLFSIYYRSMSMVELSLSDIHWARLVLEFS